MSRHEFKKSRRERLFVPLDLKKKLVRSRKVVPVIVPVNRSRIFLNVILTPLHPALPPYYRLKMRALLRAFTHLNQNLNSYFFILFFFFCSTDFDGSDFTFFSSRPEPIFIRHKLTHSGEKKRRQARQVINN